MWLCLSFLRNSCSRQASSVRLRHQQRSSKQNEVIFQFIRPIFDYLLFSFSAMNEPRVNCNPDKNHAWARDRDDTSISAIHLIRSSPESATTMICQLFILGRVVHVLGIRAFRSLLCVQRPARHVSMIFAYRRSNVNDSFDKVGSHWVYAEL